MITNPNSEGIFKRRWLDGKKIKHSRKERNRESTQKEFVHKVCVSERQLRAIENDERPVACDVLERHARALNQPADAGLTACVGWRRLVAQPETITSIGMRVWAHIGQS